MRRSITPLSLACCLYILVSACSGSDSFDATGLFEAEEYIISSETSGTIRQLNAEEGELREAGQFLGYVDSTQLFLKKKQVEAQVNVLLSKKPDVQLQMAYLLEQLAADERELSRVEKLFKSDAATQKQFDDLSSKVEITKKQIAAQRSSLEISARSIDREVVALKVQVEQLQDQLDKCRIINPVTGTILVTYARENEMTAPGKPLYKIADLSEIILRAYITGNQLPVVKLNQKVLVHTDDGDGGFRETGGIITWINDRAEFTPKTIQTKDERASQVYAIKVKVHNDGTFKIGMYGEINFSGDE